MIVRIVTEGQYRLAGQHLDKLNDYDDRIVEAVAQDNPAEYSSVLAEMMAFVRKNGAPVPTEEFVASDVIMPPGDTTFEEAKKLFVGAGIVPG